jgi:hypothetical protein
MVHDHNTKCITTWYNHTGGDLDQTKHFAHGKSEKTRNDNNIVKISISAQLVNIVAEIFNISMAACIHGLLQTTIQPSKDAMAQEGIGCATAWDTHSYGVGQF